jgi:hypothetical protein
MLVAARRKTPSSRLSIYLKGSPFNFLNPEVDWEDQTLWTAAAQQAFDPANLTNSVQIAFEKFQLNSRNPYHWPLLVHFFAYAHFGEPRRASGSPRRWSAKEYCELLADYYRTKAQHPNRPKAQICRLMKKDKTLRTRHWAKWTNETIRRNVTRAEDAKHNAFAKTMKRVLDRLLPIYRKNARQSGVGWTKSAEATVRAEAYEAVLPIMDELLAGRAGS